MTSSADVCYIDFETASAADLKKTGVSVYAEHPTTRIICMSYAFNDEPVQTWVPSQAFHPPQHNRLFDHVSAGKPIVCHNASFERTIWNTFWFSGTRLLPTQLTRDTMIRAAYWGLPMGLGDVAEALRLPFGKDKAGHRVMLQCTKPKGHHPGPDGEVEYDWWHEQDPAKLAQIIRYCEQDVELERLIDKMLPPLPKDTADEYVFDMNMNDRGLYLDIPRVSEMATLAANITKDLDMDMAKLTGGAVKNTRALADLKKWVGARGVSVTDMAKDDIVELLKDTTLADECREALELRQEAAKSSLAKLTTMLASSDAAGVVRNTLQFYGATRTGRYAGRLLQIQNFPRPHLKRADLEGAWDLVKHGQATPTLKLLSSMLRSCIVPRPGNEFVVVDFAQIEARVLAWIAGQLDILEVFERGEDVYTFAAQKIGSKDRQLGKVATLGLGYGMGPDKFIDTAATYGLKLTKTDAMIIVSAWRQANNKIKQLWYDIDDCVKDAIVHNRGVWLKPTRHADIKLGVFFHDASQTWCLLIRLPSGRLLVYREPECDGQGISYMGVDQYTKKWARIRSYGAKFVENIVQAIARDLMLAVMLEADDGNYDAVGTVHDEGIWSVPMGTGAAVLAHLEHQIKSMGQTWLPWARGLPMGCEGFVADRYGK